jgi:diketogulonate reductase-like aldo/keto reductase
MRRPSLPLKEEKKAGRVRYIAVQTIVVKSQAAQIEAIMRNEPIDFVGVDYDVSNRFAEDKILPLAQERKIGVMAFFPLSNSYGMSCAGSTQLFARAGNRPLPEWAEISTPRRGRSSFLSTSSATRRSP